jgi:hypothetical protein
VKVISPLPAMWKFVSLDAANVAATVLPKNSHEILHLQNNKN